MYFTRLLKGIIAGSMLISLLSCTEKVETGSILKDFTGIASLEALSPTAVKVSWNLHDRYKTYKVYSSNSSTPLAETSFSNVTIRNLTASTSYTFKVIAVDGTNAVGGNKELTVSTLTPFTGVDKVIKDADGNLVLSWIYAPKVLGYQIFYKKYEDPTSTNTNNWASVDYTSIDTKYVFRGLEGSTRYHFVVQVQYQDETYEHPTKSVNMFTNSTFPTPVYELSAISIGSLPSVKVTPVVNATYKNENYVSRMYSGDTPISDPLTGAGTIVFSPSSGVTNGKIENLSLKVSYSESGSTETLIFDKLSTYIKGILGINESPPIQVLDSGVAYMGEAMSTGDFNCDGYPDLAVGMPNISLASLGVKNAEAGAVYVYYSTKNITTGVYSLNTSGTPSRSPARPGVDPQILTFDDLNEQAHFGKSLSGSGNLNGDTLLGKECQDLIVGTPGYNTPSIGPNDTTNDGAAFVFFGSGRGLTTPTQIKDIQQNVETCNGLVEGATCSAVMLWPNMKLYPSADLNTTLLVPSHSQLFGYAVSFIGDFNADGYDDLAIGAPWASFDGAVAPYTSGDARNIYDAGFVAVYFGSKNGLGYETPKSTGIPNAGDDKFRFLKIFAPVPHAGQLFGYSIAGGADVDGKYKLRNSNDKLVGGSDMIIGAPGDRYPNIGGLKKPLSGNGTCPSNCLYVTPLTDGGWGGTTGTNYYGLPLDTATQTIGTAPGAAYIYFGRGANSAPASGTQESPSRSAFWQCGARNMTPGEHYSCLGSKDAVRVLFPRSYYKSGGTNALKSPGFGTAVALVGDPSHFDSNNSALSAYSDTNGDGYAEAVVAASRFQNDALTSSGALWTYYGNPFRLYEYNSFYQIDASTPTNKDLDWNDSIPRCTAFTTNNNPTKQICAPTLLRSNSIGTNYLMGSYPESIAVADVSGDGLKDVIIGATGDSTKGTNSGAVYAFTSLASMGLTTNFLKFYNTSGQGYDYFGRSVAAGNFDGDFAGVKPLNDVAAGAHLDKTAKNGGGAVYGFNSNGQALAAVNSVPSFAIYDSLGGAQSLGYESIRLVGDINRDGYVDAVAKISRPSGTSATDITDAVVFYGSKIGLISTSFCVANTNRIFKSGQGNSNYCYPSTTPAQGVTVDDIVLPQLISKPTNLSPSWAARAFDAGDINGDGFSDVAFIDWSSSAGQIVVYFGSRGGLQAVNNPQWVPAYGDPQIISKRWAQMDNTAGQSGSNRINTRREIIFHGDFNGDGLSDLVISNPDAVAFFIMNKSTGINPGDPPDGGNVAGPIAANAGWQCAGAAADSGCTSGAQPWGAGRMWIYYGSTSGVQTPKAKGYSVSDNEPAVPTNLVLSASVANYMVDAYNSESSSATNKACPGSSAAPNKSCKMQFLYDPFIENVDHGYDRNYHAFGSSVAILDYDHDGIDDLVVSAPGWEDTPCYYDQADTTDPLNVKPVRSAYGRIFLYKGSNNGLVAGNQRDYYDASYNPGECVTNDAFQRRNAASLNIDGTGQVRSLMPPITDTNGFTYSRQFGFLIASAGDVNNDGYEDLVVTAPTETPKAGLEQSGIGYIYYGPLCGNDNNTDMWINTLYKNLNNQFQFSNPSINLSPMPECTKASGVSKPAPMPFYVWDSVAGDYNGNTVMTGRSKKGDFNGDGYDDVILGSAKWDDQVNGITDFGRGIAFFGSSTGLHASDYPDSVVVADSSGHVKPYIIKRDDTSATSPNYFFANPSTGDVNGDGTMDIMVPTEYHNGYSPLIGVKIGTYFLLF